MEQEEREGWLPGFITPVGDAIYEARLDEGDGDDDEERKKVGKEVEGGGVKRGRTGEGVMPGTRGCEKNVKDEMMRKRRRGEIRRMKV